MNARAAIEEFDTALQAETLDSLLCAWHQWCSTKSLGRGFNNRSLVCGDYRISRQYDDVSGALDDDLDAIRMKQVDFEVTEMVDPYRSAIYCQARALTTGSAVFSSPRLPQGKPERDKVIHRAREILTGRLVSAGVM